MTDSPKSRSEERRLRYEQEKFSFAKRKKFVLFVPGNCGPSPEGEEYCACGCNAYAPCWKEGCPHCKGEPK